MVRSLAQRGLPKPFAVLVAALLALYFVPLAALPAQAADVGDFEIDGNLVDSPPGGAIDWSTLSPGAAGFSTSVDNTTATGQDSTTFLGASKEFNTFGESGAYPTWQFGPGNATGKSDFGRWATYSHVDANDHVWFHLGFDRGFGTGTAKYAFELNQIIQSNVNNPNPTRSQGDLRLVVWDQGNGTITLTADAQNPDVGLWRWVDPDQASDGLAEDTDKDGHWVKVVNNGTFAGASNSGDTPVAVPSWWTSGNTTAGTLTKDKFLEFAIDLTSFGAVLGCPSTGFSAANARSITGTGGPGTLVDYLSALPISVPSSCASLFIKKFQGDGTTPLGGATFKIEPNPLPVGTPGRPSDNFLTIFDDSDGNTAKEGSTNYDDPDATAGVISLGGVIPDVEYTITEVSAPDGWIKDGTSVKITPEGFKTDEDPSNTATFVNHRGSVTFTKDYEGADPATGASFTLTRDNDDADALYNNGTVNVTDNGTNDSAPAMGVIKVTPLDAGSWKLVETDVPTGWLKDTDVVFFTVPDAQGNRDVVLANPTMTDPRQTYPLKVRKVAKSDNSIVIQGAVFDLYQETGGNANAFDPGVDTKVGSCTTGANGECTVTDQAWGHKYYWVEISVPAPYNLPSNPVAGPITLNADGSTSPSGTTVFEDPRSEIVTQATNGNLPQATISDTATLSGLNDDATGSVTFDLYFTGQTEPTSSSCVPANLVTADIPATQTVAQVGNGDYTTGPISVANAGFYAWVAHYSGDNNGNRAVSGACDDTNETSFVQTLQPGLTTVAQAPDRQLPGTELYDTAKVVPVTSNATGNVDFRLYGPDDADCSGDPVFVSLDRPISVVSDGQGGFFATAESQHYTGAVAGKYRWTAHFDGDANNQNADSLCNATSEDSTVLKANPTVTTDAGADKVLGQNGVTLTDQATLSGGTTSPAITGTIVYKLYYFASNPVGDTASCTGTPVATVTTNVDKGNGTYTSPGVLVQQAGWYTWTAQYTPAVTGGADDPNNSASAVHGCGLETETVKVSKIQPTITTEVPATSVVLGQDGTDLTDTATLSGATIAPPAGGSIEFVLYGPFDLAPTANSCVAGAVFDSGAGDHNPQSVAVSGNDDYTTPNAVHVTEVGYYTWIATYSGDDNNETATHACALASETVHVTPRQPSISTVAVADDDTLPGSSVRDTATVSGLTANATGLVTFSLYSDASCTTLVTTLGPVEIGDVVDGTATAESGSYTDLVDAGTYYFIAKYNGDDNNLEVSGHCGDDHESVTIKPAPTAVSTVATAQATIQLGEKITDVATVTGLTPGATGTVTFRLYGPDDATCAGAVIFTSEAPLALSSAGNGTMTGVATSASYTPTAAGTYRWTAAYAGDANNSGSAGSCNDPNEQSVVKAGDNPGLDKFSDPVSGSTVQPGSSIHYSVKVSNTGDVAITNEPVFDDLPPNVTVVASTISDGGVLSADGKHITWQTTLAPGASHTFTFDAKVNADAPQGAVLVNTARFRNLQDTTSHVVPSGALSIVKAVSPVAGNGVVVEFGDTLTYTLTIRSTGALNQPNVVVTDYLPGRDPARPSSGETTYVAGSARCVGTGTCTVSGPDASGKLTWALGEMAAGSTRQVTFKVTIDDVAGRPGQVVAVDILNAGAVKSDRTGVIPSNEVKTPVSKVLPVKIPRELPHTGTTLPIGPVVGGAVLLLGAGLLLLVAGRRRDSWAPRP